MSEIVYPVVLTAKELAGKWKWIEGRPMLAKHKKGSTKTRVRLRRRHKEKAPDSLG